MIKYKIKYRNVKNGSTYETTISELVLCAMLGNEKYFVYMIDEVKNEL